MLPELSGKNVVVYDLETKKSFETQLGKYRDFSHEDFLDMDISCGCIYDYWDDTFKVYLEDNLDFLVERINEAEWVVGFNINIFDNGLLRAIKPDLKKDLKTYDILYWSRRAAGWQPGNKFYPSGLKLDHHLEAMFGPEYKKIEDGAHAPILYQENKMGQLITYNIDDVKKEKMVFEHICQYGTVKTLNHGELEIYNPVEEILK